MITKETAERLKYMAQKRPFWSKIKIIVAKHYNRFGINYRLRNKLKFFSLTINYRCFMVTI